MDYFCTDQIQTLTWLASVLNTAVANGQKVRISVENGDLKVKRGEGVWSPPIGSTEDPYRDHAPTDVCPGYEGDENDTDVPASCKGGHL